MINGVEEKRGEQRVMRGIRRKGEEKRVTEGMTMIDKVITRFVLPTSVQ